MNRFLLASLFLLSLCISTSSAQQFSICMDVAASSGGQGTQSNRLLTWTIGETFVLTHHGAGYAFTQGFHQPDACSVDFVNTHDLSSWGISLFPNPTDGPLVFRFSPEKKGYLIASVFDLLGRPVLQHHLLESPEGSILDTSAWPPGVYFAVLQDPATRAVSSFRFVRI